VNQALQQLDKVIQMNAANSEELASTAEELASQAEQLQDVVSYFKVEGNGKSSGVRTQKMHKPTRMTQPAVAHISHASPKKSTGGVQLALNDESETDYDTDFVKF